MLSRKRYLRERHLLFVPMRSFAALLAPLALLLATVPTLAQQTPLSNTEPPVTLLPPRSGEAVSQPSMTPVPDTLDWRGYLPLQTGNRWAFRFDYSDGRFGYSLVEVGPDTLVQGRTTKSVRECRADSPNGNPICYDITSFAYYDDEYKQVSALKQYNDGSWWSEPLGEMPSPCRYDFPFGLDEGECPNGMSVATRGGYGLTVIVSGDTVHNVAVKDVYQGYSLYWMAHGIGLLMRQYRGDADLPIQWLLYARINGHEIGQAPAWVTTASEDEPRVAARPRLRVWPNVATSTARFAVESLVDSRVVGVEVRDVLGRVVWTQREIGQGAVNVSQWSSGMYWIVVHIEDSSPLSARLVVR